MSVLLASGGGHLLAASSYSFGLPAYWDTSLKIADLNDDGTRDIVATTGDAAAVRFGNGDGTFRPALIYNAQLDATGVSNERGFAVGDLDGDGRPGLIVGNRVLLARCLR